MWKSLKLTLAAVLMLCAHICVADSLYNNLGPGNTFTINREYDVNTSFMASEFMASGSGNLGSVSIPLFSLNNPVTMGLYTDSGGRPDMLLESWSVTVPGFPGLLTTFPSVQQPLLSAGTDYWFVIDVTDAQKLHLAWYWNDQGVPGGVWFGNSLGALIEAVPNSPAPAIQLNSTATTPVPEPSSGIELGICLGLISICFVVRRGGFAALRDGWIGTRAH